MKKAEAGAGPSAPARIPERIAGLVGWREATLARMRKLIRQADPEIVEGRPQARRTRTATTTGRVDTSRSSRRPAATQ